jgi:PAS domain S-box-containing protein
MIGHDDDLRSFRGLPVETPPHPDATRLRAQAEHQAQALESPEVNALWPAEARQVLHELRVHQIELEMQNDELRATREQLEMSRARYFDLYDLSPVGYFTLSKKGLILEANLTATTLLGVSRSELSMQRFTRFILKDDQDIFYFLRGKLFHTGQTQGCELRLTRKDGTPIWVQLEAAGGLGDSAAHSWRVVAHDITDRKRAEELRSHLAAIVEFSDDAIIGKTLDGTIVSWNSAAERMYGYKAVEMIGKPVGLLSPPDRPDEIPQIMEKIRHGERIIHYETERMRKDGRRIEVALTISPIFRGTRSVVGASAIARDITEQKRAEAVLLESEQRFRNMADAAPVMIWVIDGDKNFTFFNKTWLDFTGHTLEQELSNGWTEVVQPDDLDRYLGTFFSSVDACQKFHVELRLRRADGEYRWVLCTGVPRFAPDGVFAGYIGSGMDIHDQKLTEATMRRHLDEVAHMNRVWALGELAASIAHELNQPLAAILSNAQAAKRFLNDKSVDLAQVGECLNDIVADDRRAGEVIRRLRELLIKGAPQESLVSLNEIVSDVTRLLQNDALLRQVSIKFEPAPALQPVRGDRIQLYQVVLNLVVNGLDAVAERPPDNRWVLVRTIESDEGDVQLTVEDSGQGIAEGNLHRVFEPFFTTKSGGLGMGLSICQSIVQAHGGRLWVENGANGGAIFRCMLTAVQKDATAVL